MPTTLDGYTLFKTIGSGGFCKVKIANRNTDDLTVAIKIFDP
jgi:hypothetical protein